jgi:hypothetical protein
VFSLDLDNMPRRCIRGVKANSPTFLSQLKELSSRCGRCNRTLPAQQPQDEFHSRSKNCIIIIIITTTIRQELGLNRPLSTSSNSLFKILPSPLRPFGLQFSVIYVILLFISVPCRSQSRQRDENSLPRTGNWSQVIKNVSGNRRQPYLYTEAGGSSKLSELIYQTTRHHN